VRQKIIKMSPEAFEHFMEIINRPAKPVPEILELFKRTAPWDKQEVEEIEHPTSVPVSP
jgi:uncharacterized protein (DUF1778 family)